jgi:hypothetical protein
VRFLTICYLYRCTVEQPPPLSILRRDVRPYYSSKISIKSVLRNFDTRCHRKVKRIQSTGGEMDNVNSTDRTILST